MKYSILITGLLAGMVWSEVLAQSGNMTAFPEYNHTFVGYKQYLMHSADINVAPVRGFKELGHYMFMTVVASHTLSHDGNISQESRPGSLYGPDFISNDKHCIVMYAAVPAFENQLNGMAQTGKLSRMSHWLYLNAGLPQVPDYVQQFIEKYTAEDWNAQLNADSVYIATLPSRNQVEVLHAELQNEMEDKYPVCQMISLCKNNQPEMHFLVFYTDKGFKHKDKYIDKLLASIRFEE